MTDEEIQLDITRMIACRRDDIARVNENILSLTETRDRLEAQLEAFHYCLGLVQRKSKKP